MPEVFGDLLQPLQTTRGLFAFVINLAGVGLVFAASIVRTMVPLRALTVASNLLLLVSAFIAKEPANVVLYLLLIPLNTYRLAEIRRLTRRVEQAAAHRDTSGLWLRPYMKTHKFKAGQVLFERGDGADSIYMLVEGDLELVEIVKRVPHGEIFGEIACFSPERVRTLSARCVTDCVILSITKEVFEQLYFEEPKLAFHVSNLIAERLSADIARLKKEIERVSAAAR
ncbi:MAG TPA: Crp/Fnr family transcriptional regulator [Ramlibacter sp.]|nr:Crp/Fnr family transcriptional regulator [Ramlibacter sp.]